MDSLAETAAWVTQARKQDNLLLSVYPMLTQKLDGTPRFLLEDDAIHTAVELTLGRPKIMLEAINYIRIPYPKMWIEWGESGRANLRDKFPENTQYEPNRPLPVHVGFLLESDNGRKGSATWAWDSPPIIDGFNPPNVGIISAYFDLDRRFSLPSDRIKGLGGGNLAKLWKDNPTQLKALFGIWETSEHHPNEWGAEYLTQSPIDLNVAFADVYGEYIMIWAIMLLLTASRPIVDYTPVDLSKLNKARAKRQQTPRLDHTKVTMHVDQATIKSQVRAPLGYTRKSPRVHMVSRYLARRGDKHWICEPYLRGKGDVIHRRVTVKR
jgi:hypothetical protein